MPFSGETRPTNSIRFGPAAPVALSERQFQLWSLPQGVVKAALAGRAEVGRLPAAAVPLNLAAGPYPLDPRGQGGFLGGNRCNRSSGGITLRSRGPRERPAGKDRSKTRGDLMSAGAAAAAAAKRRREAEEEHMTPYSPRDLAEDWEFKILRSATGAFKNPALMQRWLADRQLPVPEARPTGMRMMMNGVEHDMLMPGMLTESQMKQLDQARGAEFDRLFLTFMIQHHEGALTMAAKLFDSPGAGQTPEIFGYATGTNLLFPFAVGAATALFSGRSEPGTVFDVVARFRPTILTSVPTMISGMVNLAAEPGGAAARGSHRGGANHRG